MTSPKIARHDTRKIVRGTPHQQMVDELAVEEPLEIHVNGELFTTVMRTPGDDFDLVAGMLVCEGVVRSPQQISAIRYVTIEGHSEQRNMVNVALTNGVKHDVKAKQRLTTYETLGVCGKAAIEHVRQLIRPSHAKIRLKLEMFYTLGATLRRAQTVLERTGGLYAVGLFDTQGTLVGMREDVVRHNAVEKLIGHMFLNEKLPLDKHLLLVSGRACFEVMQKAYMASIPVVCTVGAPSSLAVQFAQDTGTTLIGFLTSEAYNVYAGAERIEV